MSCKKSCQGISYNEYYANKRYECPCPTPAPTPCPTPYTPCTKPVCDILIGQSKLCPVPTPCVTKPVCDILRCNEPKICPIQTPCDATPVCDILADRCDSC
jgi:hypothetical protein